MPRQLLGTAIAANTITTTQLQTTVVNQISAGGGPRVTSLVYPGNDTAGNTVGGQTVYVNGSGFETNNAIYINGNAVPSKSFISASNLSFTTPALSAGIYPVYVINTDTGATAIFIPGYVSSAEPTWVTSAGSLSASQDELGTWTYNLSATGDAPITYALAAGSSLPSGISLAANGLISGTLSSPSGNTTTYTFSVVASDAQNQDSTRQFTVTTSAGEGVLFANNVLLIHADGTNNGNNHAFIDSSNNNFTITRYGNATQGSFSPFSQTGWSNLFDGVDDNLSVSAGSGSWADFGSGEFTIEAWIFPRTVSTLQGICGTHTGGTNTWQFRLNNATLEIFGGASGGTAYAGGSVAANTWTHVAACRSGTNVYIFVNGILTTRSVGSSDTFPASTNVTIGNLYSSPSAYWFNGYISNLRILKGTAQYTSNTTPPTSALTAISNTSLLTCQSNRFIDTNTTAKTITTAGSPSVQAWSPFAPTAAYTTANVGGSVYLDGTGDYLTVPDNVAFTVSSDNWTLEAWVYPTASPAQAIILGQWSGSSDGSIAMMLSNDSNRYLRGLVYSGGYVDRVSATSLQLNAWNHCAFVREGTYLNLYLNGSRIDNYNWGSGTVQDSSVSVSIGASSSGSQPAQGYISNARFVKGTAVYSGSTYTVPTAPLTNIANTSLLCNFTNAQIFDQTAKNVLECVGDAKVSTAQYKYGTGSMYFDGTGDWLQIPYNEYFNIGSSNYTVEAWIKTTVTTGEIVSAFSSSSPFPGWLFGIGFNNNDGKLKFYNANGSSSESFTSTGTVNDNNWNHVAVTKSGTSLRFFINGILDSTHTMTIVGTGSTQPILIGADNNSSKGRYYTGYIDDLRITKGYARYTSNFTPPTSALKDK